MAELVTVVKIGYTFFESINILFFKHKAFN